MSGNKAPILSTGGIKNLSLDFRSNLGNVYPAFYFRLFIAASAGGDLWGYKVNPDGTISDPKIYEWDHELAEEEPEENTYFVKSDSLHAFLEWHLTHLSAT